VIVAVNTSDEPIGVPETVALIITVMIGDRADMEATGQERPFRYRLVRGYPRAQLYERQ